MALTDTAGGTQTDPGTGKPSENPPAAPNKPTPPKEETPPGAPEKYAFTAPEGQELDTSALAQFEPVARELNLTQEQAQKLVDVYPKVLAGVQQQQAESWQKQTEDWAAAVKFYFTGCGLQRRPALLPRDRQSAPESAIFRARHSTGASLSSRKATK